jgi:hypothetical protein
MAHLNLLDTTNTCGQTVLRLVSRGHAIIAETLRISKWIPDEFWLKTKVRGLRVYIPCPRRAYVGMGCTHCRPLGTFSPYIPPPTRTPPACRPRHPLQEVV